MASGEDTAQETGENFGAAAALCFEDVEQRRFRYHLRRLTLAGLTNEDVDHLVELGRLAFQDSDLRDQLTKIRARSDASPLAVAFVDILERAGRGLGGPVRAKSVLLGAVLGA
jgi:hypothetical protein